MATVSYRQASRVYPGSDRAAVEKLDLDIADGEFMVLVGPSGCGKSTLLRLIAGLERASAGRILIDGQDVTDRSAGERGLAMVFQSYALYPPMSVRRNLAFGLENTRLPRAEIATRIADVARLLEIEALLDRRPGQLSGGQRQRVAIGRAIVRDPTAFLLDEPLSNLDAELRGAMRAELAALHRRLGRTMIHVTHDQVEAMTLADRIVVLRDGRIEQVGTATASNNYFRQISATLGTAVVGSVFTARLSTLLLERMPAAAGDTDTHSLTPGAVSQLPDAIRTPIIASYNDALTPIFLYMTPLAIIAAIILCFVVEKPLATSIKRGGPAADAHEEAVVEAADDIAGTVEAVTTGAATAGTVDPDDEREKVLVD